MNGKIYSLTCFTTGKVFIGATYQELKDELQDIEDIVSHNKIPQKPFYRYNCYLKKDRYTFYYKIILSNNNHKIELIEDLHTEHPTELYQRCIGLTRLIIL